MSGLSLDQFSQRGLNLLGTIFGAGDTRVLLSSRATHPATVALESRTVVLDPQRTGLYDLALCARLLQQQALRRSGRGPRARRDDWLTRKAHRQFVPRTHDDLRRAYPGIVRLPGRFRPGSSLEGLQVVARTVEWRPLRKLELEPQGTLDRQPDGSWRPADVEFVEVPEIDITGADDDFAWLLDAIHNGHIALQTLPELEDLPFVRVPFRLCMSESCPTLETIEELVSRPENKELIEGLMGCFRRKSEVRQERSNLGRHTRHGLRLDTNRLVDAVIARRINAEPRLFRQRGTTIEPVFDPREHLVVIAFDVNDLRRQDDWDEEDRREAVQRLLACMITAYQRLEIDCIVIGFADQLLTLPDGRHMCLHFANTLKRVEDDVDSGFWNRMGHLLARPLQLPGVPACFHPLALRDINSAFDRVAREQDHSYRAIVWWARRGMHRDFPQFRTADFLMRTADHVDGAMLQFEQRFSGTIDTLGSFLPVELKDHGRPGGYLQNIQIA